MKKELTIGFILKEKHNNDESMNKIEKEITDIIEKYIITDTDTGELCFFVWE